MLATFLNEMIPFNSHKSATSTFAIGRTCDDDLVHFDGEAFSNNALDN